MNDEQTKKERDEEFLKAMISGESYRNDPRENETSEKFSMEEVVPKVESSKKSGSLEFRDTIPRAGIQTESTKPTGLIVPTVQNTVSTEDFSNESGRRISVKQRKASFEEYRSAFLIVPKITDRQPVFVSREIRDRIDGIVRRLGERKMSVSGFLENLTRHHLESYAEEIKGWKRL